MPKATLAMNIAELPMISLRDKIQIIRIKTWVFKLLKAKANTLILFYSLSSTNISLCFYWKVLIYSKEENENHSYNNFLQSLKRFNCFFLKYTSAEWARIIDFLPSIQTLLVEIFFADNTSFQLLNNNFHFAKADCTILIIF